MIYRVVRYTSGDGHSFVGNFTSLEKAEAELEKDFVLLVENFTKRNRMVCDDDPKSLKEHKAELPIPCTELDGVRHYSLHGYRFEHSIYQEELDGQ